MALEAPIEVFEGAKWYWTAAFAGAGVTAITAGEWLANNIQMAKKVVPFNDHNSAAQTLSGSLAITLAGLIGNSDVTNVKQQRAIGVGHLVAGIACIVKHWGVLGPLSKGLCVLHVATGLVQVALKPKAKKAAAAGAAAAAAGKK